MANEASVGCVVTTTIDAGVGTASALHLAATLPPPAPACGLATAALLEADLLTTPLRIHQGEMRLPDAPGLGVEADGELLARYAIDLPWRP